MDEGNGHIRQQRIGSAPRGASLNLVNEIPRRVYVFGLSRSSLTLGRTLCLQLRPAEGLSAMSLG